jgi:ligand-binding sensor domain-containing protein/signal transduction histidine kinase
MNYEKPNPGKTIFFLFLILSAGLLTAETLPLHHYSLREGLPDPFIKSIYQDSSGYLWFGTYNGISRFDGKEFKNFFVKDGLLDPLIIDIMESRSGITWFISPRSEAVGLKDGEFQHRINAEGLPKDGLYCIAEAPDGSLWIGSYKGAHKISTDSTVTLLSRKNGLLSNIILNILPAKDGSIWFASLPGVSRLRNGKIENFTSASGRPIVNIPALKEDKKGRIWCFSEDQGVFVFDGKQFRSYTTADGLASNNVYCSMVDGYDRIWFGTNKGISIFSNGSFTNFTTQNGLSTNSISSLFEDNEGNIWIGSRIGVSCLKSMQIVNFTRHKGMNDILVYDIIEDRNGRFWIGSEDGLCLYHEGKTRVFSTKDGLTNNTVFGLMEDRRGNIWIATDGGGINIYSNGQFQRYYSYDENKEGDGNLKDRVIHCFHQDKKGITWIGTQSGLYKFENNRITAPQFIKNRVSDLEVRKITEDHQGNLWFASPNGLYRLSASRESLSQFTVKHGLPGNAVRTLLLGTDGAIWIGTSRGLSHFKNGLFSNYTTADGLPDNDCNFIQEDDKGYIWVGTANGIARFKDDTFTTYTKEDGFPVDNWTDAGSYKDRRGYIWIGGIKGVTRFYPELSPTAASPPPVYITGVKVLERNVSIKQQLKLKHIQNYLKFQFVGLSLRAPGSVVYKYRLSGIDLEWSETQERQVAYPYLPPGDYCFQVKAYSRGAGSKEAAEFKFKILPPFWNTWWFYTLLILASLSIVAVTLYLRLKRIRQKMEYEARTRQLVMAQRMELLGILAAGAVHDLKNLLAIILGYSKMAEKNYNTKSDDSAANHSSNDRAGMSIEKIKKTAGTAIQVVKQILAFTRQKHDENIEANLVDLLKDILDILNITRPPEVRITWDPPGQDIRYRINPTRFQQLVMNLCLNAIQAMPEGGELKISLSLTPPDETSISQSQSSIQLEISDTGIGIEKNLLNHIFDPLYTTKEQGKGTGLGLFVVKQIVDDYGGNIEVFSEPGRGTCFTITFVL